jgi:hypothetical protein
MTAPDSLPITYGTVSGTPIVGDVNVGTLTAQRVYVTIGGTAYVRAPPGGYPDPNPGLGAQASLTAFPQTIAPSTRVLLFSDEAAALVAASAASYS